MFADQDSSELSIQELLAPQSSLGGYNLIEKVKGSHSDLGNDHSSLNLTSSMDPFQHVHYTVNLGLPI